jgi:hypothetical protein
MAQDVFHVKAARPDCRAPQRPKSGDVVEESGTATETSTAWPQETPGRGSWLLDWKGDRWLGEDRLRATSTFHVKRGSWQTADVAPPVRALADRWA